MDDERESREKDFQSFLRTFRKFPVWRKLALILVFFLGAAAGVRYIYVRTLLDQILCFVIEISSLCVLVALGTWGKRGWKGRD